MQTKSFLRWSLKLAKIDIVQQIINNQSIAFLAQSLSRQKTWKNLIGKTVCVFASSSRWWRERDNENIKYTTIACIAECERASIVRNRKKIYKLWAANGNQY